MMQGTINGVGVRTGIAGLWSIISSLALHLNFKISCQDNLLEIITLSRFFEEVVNHCLNSSIHYVGTSAFAPKGSRRGLSVMVFHATRGYFPPFTLLDYSTQVFDSKIDLVRVCETKNM